MKQTLIGLTFGLCVLSSGCVRAAPGKFSALQAPATAARPLMKINNLRCEEVATPRGIESQSPRLSWQLDSTLRGARQATYQIWVASQPELLATGKADLWDSGQVRSADTTQIAYKGQPLRSNQTCFWKVRAWMPDGKTSAQSEAASWQMGLLSEADWHGGWLGYSGDKDGAAVDRVPTLQGASWVWFPETTGDPKVAAPVGTRYFRQTFAVSPAQKAALTDAMLRVAADNKAVISINGREVGVAENSWQKREAINIARDIVAGENVIALAVSNLSDTAEGAPNPAGVAAQLEAHFNEGAPLTVNSDASWKVSDSAPQNWQNLGFNDDNWRAVQVLAPTGEGPWGQINNNVLTTGLPAPYLRRNFEIGGKVKRATAYICGLGYYEMSLNGRKVGDHVLDPGWTRYDRRSLYVAHDVTDYLKSGANALGVVLGTGHFDDHVLAVWDFDTASWRARPKMKMEMRVEYQDGRVQTVSSDGNWKAANGPIRFDSISSGERYDARLEMPNWDTTNFDDSKWATAESVEPVKGVLSAQIAPAIKITQTIVPVKVTQPTPGVFIVDLGQNIAGVPQLRAQGPAGTQVSMRCAEQLHPDGTLDASSIDVFLRRRDPNAIFQTDFYTFKGQGQEVWNPNFTYHGFRYIEVKGFPGTPTVDNFRGLVMHNAFAEAGQFSCSNPLLNDIQRIAHWSYRNNWHSIPTDCPQREKNGWTADAHLATEMGLYNFDGAANYEKWLRDIADEQRDDGSYSAIIPTSGWGYNIGPAWDSAYPIIAWYLYQYRGDETMIQQHYPRFVKYLDYLSSRSKDGLVDYGLGDWLPAKTQTPNTLTSTSYYYADAILLSKMAKLLGKEDDALKYSELAARIKTAFNAKFYDAQTGKYDNGSITAQSCALYQGLVEDGNKPAVFAALLAEIERQDYHMDVGILGAKYVLNTLADQGRADVAYRMLQKRTMPSYGYWIDKGATTMWERWTDKDNNDDSRDHVMFGDVSAWFYKYLAGIQIDSPGFKTFKLEPHVVGDLTAAHATHDTVYGEIVSDWKIENGEFRWQVTVPANTAATLKMPFAAMGLTEAGQPIAQSQGVSALGENKGIAVFKIEPGTYNFACAAPKTG